MQSNAAPGERPATTSDAFKRLLRQAAPAAFAVLTVVVAPTAAAQSHQQISFSQVTSIGSREALRTAILADEEATERTRLAAARTRLTERLAARDTQGADEARAAITRHEDALASIARELAASTAASPARLLPAFRPGALNAAPARPADAAPPWWDVYSERSRPTAAMPGPAPGPASGPAPALASPPLR
jgi:hypothetical protein